MVFTACNRRFLKLVLPLFLSSPVLRVPAEESLSSAHSTDVLVYGEELGDKRVTEIKTLNTPQSFAAPEKLAQWEQRKMHLRRRILVSAGLSPMPEKGPVRSEVFDKKEYKGYFVEKVLLESWPGCYVTGNLYRPAPEKPNRKYPGLLCPHGHWEHGRFETSDTASVPGRAINFARQGYVCFTYDMVGYGDNVQLLYPHRFFSKRAVLWGLHPGALQLWNTIRALDFLETLTDVDPEAIGCTGASGGGTQTFMASAVDERIKVAAPVNMISHSMQGGCICENLPHLRIDTNNMEIGALVAPRPLMMVSATGDWTKKTPEIEYPAVRSVYRLYDAEDRVASHQEVAEHNYNRSSREAVYSWFGRWFYPARPQEDFREKDFEVPAKIDLAVFGRRKVPSNAASWFELLTTMKDAHQEQLRRYLSGDLEKFKEAFGTAYRMTLAVEEPSNDDIEVDNYSMLETDKWKVERFIIQNKNTGQRVPSNLWLTEEVERNSPVLLIHPRGKRGGVDAEGNPTGKLLQYLTEDVPVLCIDCYGTGEFLFDGAYKERAASVNHYDAYNLPETSCRVQDILLAESYLAKRFAAPPIIDGLAGAGGWVLLAHGLASKSAKTIADLSDVETADDGYFVESLMIANLRRVGDFQTSVILGGDRPVEWHNCEDEVLERRLKEAQDRVRR